VDSDEETAVPVVVKRSQSKTMPGNQNELEALRALAVQQALHLVLVQIAVSLRVFAESKRRFGKHGISECVFGARDEQLQRL
jgi:UDP-N-acetylmuramate-alanine ligase